MPFPGTSLGYFFVVIPVVCPSGLCRSLGAEGIFGKNRDVITSLMVDAVF